MSVQLKDLSRGWLVARSARVAAAQARRLVAWRLNSRRWPPPRHARPGERFPHRIETVAVSLKRSDPWAHPVFEAGKRHNVALAAPSFDGVVLSPARPLSFWRALGPATEARGYVSGMELAGGCVVPSIGGGICLLSNALFGLAARLGWTIHERHGHSVEAIPPIPGALPGLDATVFWPHVDLVVAPATGRARLSCRVVDDQLWLAVDATEPPAVDVMLQSTDERVDRGHPDPVRHNTIVRRTLSRATGRVLTVEVVARNRTRLRHDARAARNCLTCGEYGCDARRTKVRTA